MPVSWSFDSTTGVVTTNCRGEVTADEICRALREKFNDDRVRAPVLALYDCRRITKIALSDDGILEALALVKSALPRLGRPRAALVAPSGLVPGLSRPINLINEYVEAELEVFYELETALAWLTRSAPLD